MVKFFLLICTVVVLFSGCTTQKDRTDAEMFKLANEAFQDYLWELGIDRKLFTAPIIEEQQNGVKSYKWLAIGSENNPIGLEIRATKASNIELDWLFIGDSDAWLKLRGTRPQNDIYFQLCNYFTYFCAKKNN